MKHPSAVPLCPPQGGCPVGQTPRDPDLALVLRARAGDQNAFTPLWEKYWRSLYNYFAGKVDNADEAEDLASETLCAAFKQLDTFRGMSTTETAPAGTEGDALQNAQSSPCTFRTYLFAIAHNQLALWLRRKKTRPLQAFAEMFADPEDQDEERQDRLMADTEADPLRALLHQERMDTVSYALADVGLRSVEQFKALLFHYVCDLPHKEVASLLGTRKETINTRLQEARQTLRNHYQRTI